MMSDSNNSDKKRNDENQTASGVYFKSIHMLIGLCIVVLLVIGVAVLVYFAASRNNSMSPKPDPQKRWEECKKQAYEKKCKIDCPSFKGTSTTKKVSTLPTTATTPTPVNFRLPNTLDPVRYELILKPNMYGDNETLFTFDGSVKIRIHCSRQTNVIVLHSKDLTYINNSLSLTHIHGHNVRISHYTFDKLRDFIKFHVAEFLQPQQEYVLSVTFVGPLARRPFGLYLSSYRRGNNTVYLALSQLAAIHARTIFPCFDEPAFKAVYQVSIARKANKISLSNMEIIETRTIADDFIMDVYNESVKMSVYTLAFVVCDFVNTTITSNGVQVNVWTRSEVREQSIVSLNYAVIIISYFNELFQQSYQLRTLDMVAVPDIGVVAMENWGLVIYNENALLHTDKQLPASHKQFVAILVAHELAHMWFGNQVTMEWWNDIWLSEGFATFFSVMAVDYLEPKWKILDSFRTPASSYALTYDSHTSSHPIYIPNLTAQHIGGVFDIISYRKSAHVLKMLRFVLGRQTFIDGINHYLRKHAYTNVGYRDFILAMHESSHQDVKWIMETWLHQMNFPLIHISTVGVRRDTVEISQERYLTSKNQTESTKYKSRFGYKWRIPIALSSNSPGYDNNTVKIYWLSDADKKKTFHVTYTVKNHEWILGNQGDNVFCRVNYDIKNWRLLVQQLNIDHTKIAMVDRITIINDACSLAKASYLNTTVCLDVLSYLHKEKQLPVLLTAFNEIQFIDDKLQLRPVYGNFSKWMKSKVSVLYKSLTTFSSNITDASELHKMSLVTYYACYYGDTHCLTKMKNLYKAHTETGNKTDPNFLKTMYCYGVKQGEPEDWIALYNSLDQGTLFENKCIIFALGCTNRVWQLNLYLHLSMYNMRSQNIDTAIRTITSTAIGHYIGFNYFRNQWKELVKRFGSRSFFLRRILYHVTYQMNTRSELNKLRAFRATHAGHGVSDDRFAAAISRVVSNVEWMDNNENAIVNWLNQHSMGG